MNVYQQAFFFALAGIVLAIFVGWVASEIYFYFERRRINRL